MKIRSSIFLIFCLFVFGANIVDGQPTSASMTDFTAVLVFDPFDAYGNGPIGGFIALGTVICPGTEPIGGQCPAGSRGIFKGHTRYGRVDSDDPRFDGWETYESSGEWSAFGTGPIQVRVSIDVDSGGTWTGVCLGNYSIQGTQWLESAHCNLQGDGGIVDGQHAMYTTTSLRDSPVVFASINDFDGVIIDPHSN